jgi:DNA polymerase-3 subunit epsilon
MTYQRDIFKVQSDNNEELVRKLEGNGDYRVLTRLGTPTRYCQPNGSETKTGVFLDLETTGLNYLNAEIIEIALIPFRYSSEGKIFEVLEPFNQLQQPKTGPIPKEITKITGITNEMVEGQQIDKLRLSELVSQAALVIAHNANFDRKFAEAEFDFFAAKPWACTMSQIPWREEGMEGGKLEYLAMKSGFFYDAHRASKDCYAGIELLSRNLPMTGRLAMTVLLEEARKSTRRVWAERAPFDFKDILKERGYRWNDGNDGRPKAWNIDVSEDGLSSELSFLRKEIYQREVELPTTTITALDRFSDRA